MVHPGPFVLMLMPKAPCQGWIKGNCVEVPLSVCHGRWPYALTFTSSDVALCPDRRASPSTEAAGGEGLAAIPGQGAASRVAPSGAALAHPSGTTHQGVVRARRQSPAWARYVAVAMVTTVIHKSTRHRPTPHINPYDPHPPS